MLMCPNCEEDMILNIVMDKGKDISFWLCPDCDYREENEWRTKNM